MPIRKTLTAGRWPVLVYTEDIEESAEAQLANLAQMPFIHHHVAAMPDVHWGMGATVGSVIATHKAVIPAAVGVDIGCGMCAVRLSLGAAHPGIEQAKPNKWVRQLGTLGGGNHFIEVCLDESGSVWVMLHSGSRNIGKVIADYFITRAKEHMERWHIPLPDRDLAYLPDGTQDFADYVRAVEWAQEYAAWNRRIMLRIVLSALAEHLPPFDATAEAINCHHNYISRENHYGANVIVTRKGAIRARSGDLGIIPGSMGARSYIVRGLGSAESFHSCSHGAGRRMGRKEAKRRFTASDLAEQTEGVECRKDDGVVDEIPAAYKDIDAVMANQTDLVEPIHTLRQVICVKG